MAITTSMNLESDASSTNSGVHEHFDVEEAIQNLLADASCQSLELPSQLSSEDRRRARTLAAAHAELKCESYGFGAERRLHLFKKSATTCIRVKNTFIEGCVSEDGHDVTASNFLCKSLPAKLPAQALAGAQGPVGCGQLELSPITKKQPSAQSATPRTDEEDPAFASYIPQDPAFAIGTLVIIEGLVKLPDFNGQIGVVHSLDETTGRYDVLLNSPASGRQWAKVKQSNMRPAITVAAPQASVPFGNGHQAPPAA